MELILITMTTDLAEAHPESSLVSIEYILRDAPLCPLNQQEDEKAHHFVDTVDSDMFLREN